MTIPNGYAAVCRSFTVNSGGTITIANTVTATLAIGDGTAGAGNVAISINSGATVNLSAAFGAWSLASTSATQQTISTGGKTIPTLNLGTGASAPSYLLSDALTCAGIITHSRGTFDTAGYSVTDTKFDTSNSNTRTLTMGASVWTNTLAGEAWTSTVVTNLTFNSNTSTVKLTGAGASMRSNALTFYNVEFSGGGAMNLNSGGNALTYNNLTVTNPANQTSTALFSVNGQTVNGALVIAGNSNVNRIVGLSAAPGSARSLTLGASATFKTGSSNFDMQDITATGGAANERDFSAINTVGDRGGNTGITFITGVTQTRDSTNGQAWSVVARWSSGYLPLPQDTVLLDSSSGSISTTDVLCLGGTQDYSGYTGTITHTTNTGTFTVFGSFTMGSGMSFGATVNTFNLDFAGRGSYMITSNGVSPFPANSNQSIQINAPNGTYTLGDVFVQYHPGTLALSFRIIAGTFDSASYTMTVSRIVMSGTLTKSATWGTSTVNVSANTSTVMISLVATATTWSADNATFVIANPYVNSATRTIDLAGFRIGALTYTVANSTSPLSFTGSSVITTLTVNSAHQINVSTAATLSVQNWNVAGSDFDYVYMPGDGYGASVTDSAALSITGDMDIRLRCSIDNIALAGAQRLCAKYIGTGNQRTWRLYSSSGSLVLDMSTTGSDSSLATASQTLTAAGLSSGTTYWFRVKRVQSTGKVDFYYMADSPTQPGNGAAWISIGAQQTATTSALFDSTSLLTVGGEQLGTNSNPAKWYRFQIRNNVLDDGTGIQADIDFTTKTVGADTFTESSSNAATVTMANGSVLGDGRVALISNTAGTQAVTNALLGYWSTSYMSIKDIRMQDPYMFYAGTTSTNVSNNLNVNFTAPPAAPLIRQSKYVNVGSTNTHTATFDYPTVAGNLLIYAAAWQLNMGSFTTPPAGFTLAKDANESTNVYVKIYYKVADGTETSVTASWQNTRSNDITIYEINNWTGTPTLDVTDSNTNAGAVTALSTGAGVSNTSSPAFALALVGAQGTLGASVTGTPPTNNFQEDYGTTGGRDRIAALPLTATGSQSTTLTWTTSRTGAAGALAIFKDVASATNTGNFFAFF